MQTFISFRLKSFLVLLVLLNLIACATGHPVVGKWRQLDRTATVEFSPDGTFQAVDNQGMAVQGTYDIPAEGLIRFHMDHPDGDKETVEAAMTLMDNRLTFTFAGDEQVDTYTRIR